MEGKRELYTKRNTFYDLRSLEAHFETSLPERDRCPDMEYPNSYPHEFDTFHLPLCEAGCTLLARICSLKKFLHWYKVSIVS